MNLLYIIGRKKNFYASTLTSVILIKSINHKSVSLLVFIRRRSLQFHYAASECKPTKCPKQKADPEPSAPRYFDCDPSCVEPEYWYYRKAEILVTGKEYGGDYI